MKRLTFKRLTNWFGQSRSAWAFRFDASSRLGSGTESEPTGEVAEAEFPHLEGGLADDRFAHFRLSLGALGKDDGDLGDVESRVPGAVVHFHLKGVAVGVDAVEGERLQHAAVKTLKARSHVADGHPGNDARVDAGGIRQDEAGKRPVDDPDAANVPRAHGEVGRARFDGVDEAGKVVGVVREVRVHLADVGVVAGQGVSEAA